jgi:hypothetical protein
MRCATATAAGWRVLIFDEVMTSRLAPGGLQSVHGVKPDLTTFGKYIGGGMSFGAFGGRADIMDLFDPRRADALPHAGTFNNNVLTMSAGLTGLTEVYTPPAAQALNARGDALRERLNALCRAADAPMQFTGIGSMLAVHMMRGADPLAGGCRQGRCEAEGAVLLRHAGAGDLAGAARHDDAVAADRRCRVRQARRRGGGVSGVAAEGRAAGIRSHQRRRHILDQHREPTRQGARLQIVRCRWHVERRGVRDQGQAGVRKIEVHAESMFQQCLKRRR